jgi:hypothetical protein
MTIVGNFGRPLLVRSIELIRAIKPISAKARVSQDPQRLALLLWSGLHGMISLRINKPTLDWPSAIELAEQITRAIIQPKQPRPLQFAEWGIANPWGSGLSERRFEDGDVLFNAATTYADAGDQFAVAFERRSAAH